MIKLNSSFSGGMVNIYDAFFLAGNKCAEDCNYINEIFKKNGANKDILLDVGCGTGAYDEIFSNYYGEVVAIDISQDMISYAKQHHSADNIDYICKDATTQSIILKRADVAISLAHVIGYQYSNDKVDAFLNTVQMNLKDNGLFFFNFYNISAVLNGKLAPRSVHMENGKAIITRVSNANILLDENCIALDYYYIIENDSKSDFIEVHEKMRCFSIMEIEHYLKHNGFKEIAFFDCGAEIDKLSYNNWNITCLAKKF